MTYVPNVRYPQNVRTELWQERFVQALGDAATRSGVLSEMAGKIYGALYVSPGPKSLDELCSELDASKGNVSVQVRELLTLGMVRKAPGMHGRRHYYEAVTDLWPIATEVIGRRMENEMHTLLRALDDVERELASAPGPGEPVRTRLATLRVFLQMAAGLLEGFRRGEAVNAEDLRKVGR